MDSVSGVFLRVDAAAQERLHARLKRLPAVAGSTTRLAALRSFEDTIAQSFSIFTTVLVSFACAIAAAMVYNAARIALSERSRELASLRVLGFTRREIAVLLLGEQALLTVLALPVGFAIGYRDVPDDRARVSARAVRDPAGRGGQRLPVRTGDSCSSPRWPPAGWSGAASTGSISWPC